jgi:7-keto-8-aminopelargonate synthetase-like enzyme
LANRPEVRKADAEAAAAYGSAYPMGARMMSGHTDLHEQLQNELAEFVNKEAAYLLNFGYQGMVSTIDALVRLKAKKCVRSKPLLTLHPVVLSNPALCHQSAEYCSQV